jgi:hypothetical protein
VELAEEFVEQVAAGGGVAVAVCSSLPVVLAGRFEGGGSWATTPSAPPTDSTA